MSNHIFEAALELQDFCQRHKWRFCFIGGVAFQRWGEPRTTVDADLTLLANFGEEEQFLTPLLRTFKPRIENAEQFALVNRVLLIQASNGVPLDVALASTSFERSSVKRATPFKLKSGRTLMTCSAEDLVVHKAFANRPKDWIDIEVVLMKQHGKLNWTLIWQELLPLIELKEEPEIEDRLRKLKDKIDRLGR